MGSDPKMDYFQSCEFIENLPRNAADLALGRMNAFCEHYGSLQNSYLSLHVGGTNGKGSTAAILDSVLRSCGYKVGRFTGPHLLRWNERFHINGKPIDDHQFAHYATDISGRSKEFAQLYPDYGSLSWFEFLTAMAFAMFAESKIEVGVFEVGLGGRFDATNVLAKPLAVGITNVSYDHTQILGKTIEQIAFEKAGIIKSEVPVVTAADESALKIITERAKILGAPLFCLSKTSSNADADLSTFDLDDREIERVLSLRGSHQLRNAKVALYMLKLANLIGTDGVIDREIIEHGLKAVYWPGRLQMIEIGGTTIVLDGAHNEAGILALRSSLEELFPGKNVSFVFACYGNKDGSVMLQNLLRPGDKLFVSEAHVKRETFPKNILVDEAKSRGISVSAHPSISEALTCAIASKNDPKPVVVTGSLATVSEVMTSLGWHCVEDGLGVSVYSSKTF